MNNSATASASVTSGTRSVHQRGQLDRNRHRSATPSGQAAIAERDQGFALTVFLVSMTLTLLVAGALTIDGGRILAGRRAASNAAFSASRVGGQFVIVRPTSDVEIDVPQAIAQAEAYLADQGFPDHAVTATTGTVTVTVRYRVSTVLLHLIGISSKTVTATGVARPAVGITKEGG
jgi:hypothetical protein